MGSQELFLTANKMSDKKRTRQFQLLDLWMRSQSTRVTNQMEAKKRYVPVLLFALQYFTTTNKQTNKTKQNKQKTSGSLSTFECRTHMVWIASVKLLALEYHGRCVHVCLFYLILCKWNSKNYRLICCKAKQIYCNIPYSYHKFWEWRPPVSNYPTTEVTIKFDAY